MDHHTSTKPFFISMLSYLAIMIVDFFKSVFTSIGENSDLILSYIQIIIGILTICYYLKTIFFTKTKK